MQNQRSSKAEQAVGNLALRNGNSLLYAVHWVLQLNHQHLTYLLQSQNFILQKLFQLNEPALMINVVYDRSKHQNLMWLFFASQICTPHGFSFGRSHVTFLVYVSRTSRFLLRIHFTCSLSTVHHNLIRPWPFFSLKIMWQQFKIFIVKLFFGQLFLRRYSCVYQN